MRINVDVDGVLADFDGHYETLFGVRPTRFPDPDNLNWPLVKSAPRFFATIPVMPDADALIEGVKATGLPWRLLTGVPLSIDAANNEKVEWSKARPWEVPEIICCTSATKYLHCEPGDVLIDDYLKYRHKWEEAGGIYIVHTSAEKSLAELRMLLDKGMAE